MDIVAKEGSNVTLHCKAKGHPEPYVMWRREDNREIQYNGNLGKSSCFHRTSLSSFFHAGSIGDKERA